MDSVIKWNTGEPKEGGYYLITTDSGRIATDLWRIFPNRSTWEYRNKIDVKAWCKLSDIEPYKEMETKQQKKNHCGECRFYRKSELDTIMEKYCFDGVCIVEPTTLGTNSKTVSCDIFKPLQTIT